MNTITFPLSLYQNILQVLVQSSNQPLFVSVGVLQSDEQYEWLVRQMFTTITEEAISNHTLLFQITRADAVMTGADKTISPSLKGHLVIDGNMGHSWGFVRQGTQVEPLDNLNLVGPGMHQLALTEKNDSNSKQPSVLSGLHRIKSLKRWSRTIGALGGVSTWERLVRLRVAVIGCGRSGSLVAESLARQGVGKITLIDPDKIELHNVGEMTAVSERDVTSSKVESVARSLRAILPQAHNSIIEVVLPITSKTARQAAQACDVLISCVDNDAARLAAGLLAATCHKVLIDIGTGISLEPGEPDNKNGNGPSVERQLGLDVRLILPHHGCIVCFGSVRQYPRAVQDLTDQLSQKDQKPDSDNWAIERAGSLQALNQLAVSVAMLQLQGLICGEIKNSQWVQIEPNLNRTPKLTHIWFNEESRQSETCPLCARAGIGNRL